MAKRLSVRQQVAAVRRLLEHGGTTIGQIADNYPELAQGVAKVLKERNKNRGVVSGSAHLRKPIKI